MKINIRKVLYTSCAALAFGSCAGNGERFDMQAEKEKHPCNGKGGGCFNLTTHSNYQYYSTETEESIKQFFDNNTFIKKELKSNGVEVLYIIFRNNKIYSCNLSCTNPEATIPKCIAEHPNEIIFLFRTTDKYSLENMFRCAFRNNIPMNNLIFDIHITKENRKETSNFIKNNKEKISSVMYAYDIHDWRSTKADEAEEIILGNYSWIITIYFKK